MAAPESCQGIQVKLDWCVARNIFLSTASCDVSTFLKLLQLWISSNEISNYNPHTNDLMEMAGLNTNQDDVEYGWNETVAEM